MAMDDPGSGAAYVDSSPFLSLSLSRFSPPTAGATVVRRTAPLQSTDGSSHEGCSHGRCQPYARRDGTASTHPHGRRPSSGSSGQRPAEVVVEVRVRVNLDWELLTRE